MRALNYHCILHKIGIDVLSEKAWQIYGQEFKYASIIYNIYIYRTFLFDDFYGKLKKMCNICADIASLTKRYIEK